MKANIESSNNIDSDNQIPFIEANDYQNATVGKSVSLKCIVHNLKSYKVNTNSFFLIISLCKALRMVVFDSG